MKRAATMLAVSLAIAMVVAACASMKGDGRDHVARAVQAQGGADVLGKVKTVSEKATVRQWEPSSPRSPAARCASPARQRWSRSPT